MITRDEIKAWLRGPHGMSRQEFAHAMGVSLSAVNNWLSASASHPIPAAKLALIERMIEDSTAAPAQPAVELSLDSLLAEVLRIADPQMVEDTRRAAELCGLSLQGYLAMALRAQNKRELGGR